MSAPRQDSEKIRKTGPDISMGHAGAHPPTPHPDDIERDADSSRQLAQGYDLSENGIETDTIEYHADGLPRTDRYSVRKTGSDAARGTRTKSPRDSV